MKNVDYTKTKNAIKYWLLGKAEENKDYYKVLKAMDFAEKIHCDYRKDGVTPTFQHQVSIALYIKTIHKNLINPVETFVLAFLHDCYEDYPSSANELEKEFPEYFDKIKVLSKKEWQVNVENSGEDFVDIPKGYLKYFHDISLCPSCSVVKAVDRIHNVATMIGVFKKEKQIQYAKEIAENFLPMLKQSRKRFPEQENAYENLKSVLTIQMETVLNLLENI